MEERDGGHRGRAAGSDEEDGLSGRDTGSRRNTRTGLGGIDEHHGSPSATSPYKMPEGGCIPAGMADGETGPAKEGGSPLGLTCGVQTGVPSGRGGQTP